MGDQMTVWRKLKMARRIARCAGSREALRWLVEKRRNPAGTTTLFMGGRRVSLRLGSPDVNVALSCFGGEFDELISRVPTLRHPLIIDAGAYIGTSAIVFAEAYPQATVLALEPSRDNFAMLKRNVAGIPNIVPINKALAPSPGASPLYNRRTGEWGFTLVTTPADAPGAALVETVETTSIDQLLQAHGCEGIGILKLDVEGSEHALFHPVPDWIARTDVICIELHDNIVPGCTEAYRNAVEGRTNFKLSGEKQVSLTAQAQALPSPPDNRAAEQRLKEASSR